MNLRDRIRELAKQKGMSLPVLEAALGFGNGTIVKWDRASPNTDKLLKVADFFHVSTDYLLGREGTNAVGIEWEEHLSREVKELIEIYTHLSKEEQYNLMFIARYKYFDENQKVTIGAGAYGGDSTSVQLTKREIKELKKLLEKARET